jgi:hypothetical protein
MRASGLFQRAKGTGKHVCPEEGTCPTRRGLRPSRSASRRCCQPAVLDRLRAARLNMNEIRVREEGEDTRFRLRDSTTCFFFTSLGHRDKHSVPTAALTRQTWFDATPTPGSRAEVACQSVDALDSWITRLWRNAPFHAENPRNGQVSRPRLWNRD